MSSTIPPQAPPAEILTPQKSSTQPTSPTRPKHLTTRSITEISPGHGGHKHHHHPHLHRHLRKDTSGDLGAGAGGSGGSGNEQGSRSEGVTPSGSRPGSVLSGTAGNQQWEIDGIMGSFSNGKGKTIVTEGEVREEKERAVLRATELRNALMGLNTEANATTRKLDNTYYSVLEKLSMLQNTITSMKELATMTRTLNEEFKTEAEEIVTDVSTQIEGFENFSEQEKRISALAERVKTGRAKIKVLGSRVDIVRDRVEGWERGEIEWQEKTRKRLRILWIVIAVIAAVVLALVAFQYTPAMNHEMNATVTGLNKSGLLGKSPHLEMVRDNESWAAKRASGEGDGRETLDGLRNREEGLGENPRLRVFDEL